MKENLVIENYIHFPYNCNSKCKACYLWRDILNKNRVSTFTPADLDALFIERKFYKDTNIRYRLKFLWWEPTLDKNLFIKIVDYVLENDLLDSIEFISITTNAFLIKEFLNIPKIDYVKDKIEIKASIHWLWKMHDDFTQIPWRFDSVMKNIDFLLKERYDIKINIVVSQENLSHIIEMITFFYKKGIKSFFLLFVDYMSDAYVNRKELFLDFFDRDNVKEYLKIINFLDKLRSLWCEADVDTMYPVCLFKGTSYYNSVVKDLVIQRSHTYHIIKWWRYVKRYKWLDIDIDINDDYDPPEINFEIDNNIEFDEFKRILKVCTEKWNYYFYWEAINIPDMCKRCPTKDTCRLTKESFIALEWYAHWTEFIWGSYWEVFESLKEDNK